MDINRNIWRINDKIIDITVPVKMEIFRSYHDYDSYYKWKMTHEENGFTWSPTLKCWVQNYEKFPNLIEIDYHTFGKWNFDPLKKKITVK